MPVDPLGVSNGKLLRQTHQFAGEPHNLGGGVGLPADRGGEVGDRRPGPDLERGGHGGEEFRSSLDRQRLTRNTADGVAAPVRGIGEQLEDRGEEGTLRLMPFPLGAASIGPSAWRIRSSGAIAHAVPSAAANHRRANDDQIDFPPRRR